jgi:DNA-binding FadR family transcriptional regulator
LAEQFGVSRVSVREAAIALQAQGRIEIRPGSGAYVQDGSKLIGRGLPKAGPFELTEARALFEAEVAALAAPMMTDEILDQLEVYIRAMTDEDTEGSVSHDEADRLFHLTIAQATNNSAIIYTIDSMWQMRSEASKLQAVYKTVCDKGADNREREHRDIIEALRQRDPIKARAAMRAHFTRMIEALLKESEEEAYREVKRKASESRSRYLMTAQIED